MGLKNIIKKVVGFGAPVLGTVLGGPAAGRGLSMLASLFGVDATPDSISQAIALDPNAAGRIRELEVKQKGELEKIILEAAMLETEQYHETYRTELNSDDKFISRWRPFFGWVTGICFFMQFTLVLVAGGYAVLFAPESIGPTFKGLAELSGALTVIWGIAFSVLGINITSRSRDKVLAAGHAPSPGLLQGLAQKFIGGDK